MHDTRRGLLLGASALGLTAAGLAGCDQTVVAGDGASSGASANTGDAAQPPSGAGGGSGAGSGAASGSTPDSGASPSARVRYDVASAQGQAMLAIYARAVGLMMALPAADPRSWTFQWYSHWVKGAQDASAKTSQLSAVFGPGASPAKALAQVMWDGCQAHGDNEDETFFLPWHRLYLMAFEDIVRAVAQEPAFTLPYWNYLDASQRAVPAAFRSPGDPTWGVLYNASRNAAVNAGGAIASAADLNADVLSEQAYSPLGADQGFCANLDMGLHGVVHVGVGDSTGGMGVIPWAANDPIFWLHHCNIDRLWASWNAAGGVNPSDDAFTSKPFPFAGPNGEQVVHTVSKALSLEQAGYSYDALVGASGPPVSKAARLEPKHTPGFRLPTFDTAFAAAAQDTGKAPAGPGQLLAPPRLPPVLRTLPSITHATEGVQLGGRQALRIRLASTQTTPELAARTLAPLIAPPVRLQHRPSPVAAATPSSLASRLLALVRPKSSQKAAAPAPIAAPPPPSVPAPKPGQKVFLVLSRLTTDIQPGVIYEIYLEAPTGGGGTQGYPIGALSFFSAMRPMPGMAMATRARSFDITDLSASLAAQGRLESSPALAFVPVGEPVSDSQPLIGSVFLAIQ